MAEQNQNNGGSGLTNNQRWFPFIMGIILFASISIFSWNMGKRESSNLEHRIELEAKEMATLLDADMRARIPSLQRMVNRWQIRNGISKEEFVRDASSYIEDAAGYQAIEWVDSDFHVRWIIPMEGNEQAQDLNLAFEDRRRSALEAARNQKSPSMTSPIDLVQGGKGFLAYFPIFIGDEFDGFVLAVFHIEEWLDYVFETGNHHSDHHNFRIAVNFDDELVFKQMGWDLLANEGYRSESQILILNRNFTLEVVPTDHFVSTSATVLPNLTFTIGLLLSVKTVDIFSHDQN